MKNQRVTIRIDDTLREAAKAKATKMDISLSAFIAEAVEGAVGMKLHPVVMLHTALEVTAILLDCEKSGSLEAIPEQLRDLEKRLWEYLD